MATLYDDDGMLLVDGRRRFVLGAYNAPADLGDDGNRTLAEAGFWLVRAREDPADLDRIHAAGLRAWVSLGAADPGDEGRAAYAARIARLREHPALLFWETVDEPAWTWKAATARVAPEPLIATYRLLREEDPAHAVYLNHAPTNLVSTLQRYGASCDITACDIYPVIPPGIREQYALFPDGQQGDLLNCTISQVGEYTDKMRAVAGPGRPLFMVLQGFAWEALRKEGDRDPSKVLYPTLEQTRFMAYQAIVRGANGVIYWGLHATPVSEPFWADLRQVTGELARLSDVLAARAEPLDLEVEYHEMGHSVDAGVQFVAKRVADTRYILAVNADKNPARVTFRGLGEHCGAHAIGEAREVPLERGALTDDFAPFGVHVYALR